MRSKSDLLAIFANLGFTSLKNIILKPFVIVANSESDRISELVLAKAVVSAPLSAHCSVTRILCTDFDYRERSKQQRSLRCTKNPGRERIKSTSCERKFARSFEITAAGNSIYLERPEERGALRPRGFAAASSGLRNLLPRERCGDSVLFFRARLSVSNYL